MRLADGTELDPLLEGLRRFLRREIWLWEKRIDSNAQALPPDVSAELREKVRAMGLDNLLVPAAFGGPALSETARSRLAEETSQHRAGVLRPSYELFGVDVPPALFAASGAQRERFLRPLLSGEARCFQQLEGPQGPDAPTDGVRARAMWQGGRWILDGTKLFVADADAAEFGIVSANTEYEPGVRRGVSLFTVETNRAGFQRWRDYPTLSAGRDTQELNLSAVKLPPDNLLGPVGEGPAFGYDLVLRRRIFRAAHLTGVASAAQDMARSGVWSRKEFGRPLGTTDRARATLAENEVEVRAARALYLKAAGLSDRGEALEPDANIARLFAAEAAGRVVERTLELHGVAGSSTDLPLERWYRDLRVARLEDGGADGQERAIADQLSRTFKR